MTDTPPLAGQVVVFAGTLSRLSRREAGALVERQLGRVAVAVTRETTMLVLGAEVVGLRDLAEGTDVAPRERAQSDPAHGDPAHGDRGWPERGWADQGWADRGHADRGRGDRGHGDRGHGDHGPADRGHSDRGPADRGHADRGHADRGHADRGQTDAIVGGGTPDERRVAEARRLNARYPGRVRLVSEDEFYALASVEHADAAASLHGSRGIRARYPALRDDHLRYLERWGLVRPVRKTRHETFYGFADLAVIRQASAELARGLSFRAVLRALVAERTGQLAFDFQPPKGDSQPAKVIALTPRIRPARATDAAGVGGGPGGSAGAGVGADADDQAFEMAAHYFADGSALDQGDEDQQHAAVLAYRRALALDPRMVAALVNLANLHYAQDAIVEAEALYEKALGLEPTCFEAQFNLGNVYHDTRRFEEAVRCYIQALAIDTGYADAHFYLAVALEKLGRSGEARPHWQSYQRLAPEGEWVELAREFSD